MPYFSTQSTQKRFTADCSTDYFSSGQSRPYASLNTSHTSSVDLPIYRVKREGSNSSIPELIRQYGIGAFQLTKKKVVVGHEFKTFVKKIWYRDRKGNPRSRSVSVKKMVPKYLTVTKAKFIQPAIETGKYTEFYLRPNRLVFSNATNVVTPSTLTIVNEDVTNGYLSRRSVYRCHGPGLYVGPGGYNNAGFGYHNLNYIETYPGDESLAEDALRKLYSKVASDIPDYMTAAAESGELFKTLRNITKSSIKLVREIKKLDIKRLRGRLKTSASDLSSIWLTWVYGIAPVISDITDTIDVVKRHDRTWRSFSTSAKTIAYTTQDPPNINSIGVSKLEINRIERYGVILEGRISVDRIYKDQVKWQSAVGTVYELVPFSFMLDWIVNISEYLKSSQIFERQVYTAWRTSIQQESSSFTGYLGLNPDFPYNRIFSEPFSQISSNFYLNRNTPITIPEMPDIKVKKPVEDVLSLSRAINALAILVTTTDTFRRPPGLR